MSEIFKVLIVDDEFHARKLLSEYVSKLPFLELIGAAANVFEAMTVLQKERVDIMLLDIQMPEITGLEFARSLKNPPSVIFTTAYSEYAVESYELDVVDYLLKPVAFPRFLQAINKVIERRGENETNKISGNPIEVLPEKIEDDSIVVKSGYKLYKINYASLLYIEGQREYVTFHTTKQRITILSSLKDLEDRLPSDRFIRIHKSYIVSIKHIELIDKNILHIADKKLPIGGSYKEEVLKIFGL
ncbi:MAG: LytTR family DNA-binding domain-containing protein [Dysgonomonas sp.]|nr:LytTR family DNA-binding domain-containing protein [Dysgonomonas sp.]